MWPVVKLELRLHASPLACRFGIRFCPMSFSTFVLCELKVSLAGSKLQVRSKSATKMGGVGKSMEDSEGLQRVGQKSLS